MRLTGTAILAVVVAVATAGGEAAAEQVLAPKVERVALFKNGLGYFSSSLVLPEKATSVVLGQLPIPSLGAFWVGYGPKVGLHGIYASLDEAVERVPASDFARLLQANVGRKVSIRSGTEVIEGVVFSAGPPDRAEEPASPYLMGSNRAERGASPAALVVVKTERGLVALGAGTISHVDFEGGGALTTVSHVVRRPALRLELDRPAPGEKLSISYLARGISWSPSYLIDLSDPKTAQLTAAAVVVNEVADLEDVRLDLVTGFPNVVFADVASPIAMSQTLAQFLDSVRQGGDRRGGRQGIVTQQAILSNAISFQGQTQGLSSLAASAGETAEDLFLYPIERLSLRRGETVQLPLFTAEAPYQHLYTWEIADLLDAQGRYPRDGGQREEAEEVWHSCRLTNPLRMPLTTAPAQFVNEGRFAGQDVLHYTAPGAETTIRINRAMNVIAEQAEVEVDRKRDAVRFHGSSYDLVKIQGRLRIRNRMETKARLEVTKHLSGDVGETLPAAKDTQTATGLRQVNTHHTLTWTLDVLPAEEKTLSYAYDVYVND